VTRTVKTIGVAVIAATMVTVAACGGHEPTKPAGEAAEPVQVTIATAATDGWPATYEAGAVVRARQTAVVAARVVAPILEMRVAAGDRVRRGQTLVVLDGRELQAQAVRATASASGSGLALQAAQAERQAAESARVLARLTYERVQGLHQKESATKAELDEATAMLAGAEARVAGATARVAEAEQGIAAAKATEDAASVGVSYTVLTAPFDGLVSARHADPGSMAAPGVPLLTLDDVTAYRLEARVDESHAPLVSPGVEADVRLDRSDADPAVWHRARIVEVAALDPARHSFLIKLDVPRDMPDVRSGQFGRVRLLGPARQVLSVPSGAVVRRGQLTFVFAVDDSGVARLRMVSVGESFAGRTEVLAGVAEGDRVVVNAPAGLADGRPVIGGAGAGK
jgi:RND family efflux transporter MFP subunit